MAGLRGPADRDRRGRLGPDDLPLGARGAHPLAQFSSLHYASQFRVWLSWHRLVRVLVGDPKLCSSHLVFLSGLIGLRVCMHPLLMSVHFLGPTLLLSRLNQSVFEDIIGK